MPLNPSSSKSSPGQAMKNVPVSITSITSLSAMGFGPEAVWEAYVREGHSLVPVGDGTLPPLYWGALPESLTAMVAGIRSSQHVYRNLDPSVLYAMAVSRDAVRRAGWEAGSGYGVNIGSSRGATTLFERHFREFLEAGSVGAHASPGTTLGNIASWVAQDLRSGGPELSHSITCSTALHAVLNGVAWIRAGLAGRFLAGGSEAPLTAFTLAQMQALKVYSRESGPYPCRALDLEKAQNTMVLGEGAGAACLEPGQGEDALAVIEGMGYATEALRHGASLSAEADCLQRSMKMALGRLPAEEIDFVVMHAPGTLRGDLAELRAIEQVFRGRLPAVTTNKWKTGHTLGASGLLSLEMAVRMLQHQVFIGVPYLQGLPSPGRFRYAMVNAVGFGGNAVSLVLRNPAHD